MSKTGQVSIERALVRLERAKVEAEEDRVRCGFPVGQLTQWGRQRVAEQERWLEKMVGEEEGWQLRLEQLSYRAGARK